MGMITNYYCPSCGEYTVSQFEDNPKIMYCRCGMTWRTFSSDIHYTVKDDKKDAIREVLDASLVYYARKNDKGYNQMRENRKQRAIDYLLEEIFKGPIEGGTMAEPYTICSEFGTELWTALQKAILIRDDTCMICGKMPSKEVHHIRPRHLKGKNHPRNLIGLCLECHDEVHRKIDDGIQSVLESSLDIPISKNQMTFDDIIGEKSHD